MTIGRACTNGATSLVAFICNTVQSRSAERLPHSFASPFDHVV